MDWQECLEKNKIKKAFKDKGLAKSCIDMSNRFIESVKMIKLSERSAPVIMSNLYDALLSICEAVLALNGFKSYNHECVTSFLKRILNEHRISEVFDRYRKIRNKIKYYGRTVSTDTAKRAEEEIINAVDYLKNKYLRGLEGLKQSL